ncbi:hypothetical protein [Microbulbifer guangxiensis]|uniref:hypothetical protein n=1 Tax=Microbulbifer guangxiensis TaxID=2904249 RepID=UPI001F369711|nr:hypothetical protein [Microbulbifer guangxiensis]
MDIWKWVYGAAIELEDEGQERLADLLDEVPEKICSGDHDVAESLVDEALAMPACQDNAWLNVYFRHWRLQSRILHRMDVSHDALEEAVRLVEYSSREDVRDCPQSVCAIQDLTSAYAIKDGPGFAAERKAASGETLARIDPSWPCFQCISAEYADALMDSGEYEEADRFCAEQYSRKKTSDDVLLRQRSYANLKLGRIEKAYELVKDINSSMFGSSRATDQRLAKALCLIHLGDFDAALDLLPRFADIDPCHFARWSECILHLTRAGRNPFLAEMEGIFESIVKVLAKNEALYYLADTHRIAAEIAIHAEDFVMASRHLEAAKYGAKRLRKPDCIELEIFELESALHKKVAKSESSLGGAINVKHQTGESVD